MFSNILSEIIYFAGLNCAEFHEAMLIGTPNPLIWRHFPLNRECVHQEHILAFTLDPRYIPSCAQIPRHQPDARHDPHPDPRDALAFRGSAPDARGQRQVGACHRLRRPSLSPGLHGPLWLLTCLHRRFCLWRHH